MPSRPVADVLTPLDRQREGSGAGVSQGASGVWGSWAGGSVAGCGDPCAEFFSGATVAIFLEQINPLQAASAWEKAMTPPSGIPLPSPFGS